MAMLASSVLPMLMQPEVRKGMSKLVKYLLVLGGLGVGILAYIVVAKKINPLKAVGNWLKKGIKNPLGVLGSVLGVPTFQQIGKDLQKGVVGFQKDIGKGVTGFQKDVGRGILGFQKDIRKGAVGFQKDVGKGVTGFQKDVAKGWTGFWGDIGKGVAGFQKDVGAKLKVSARKRKTLRTVSKPIIRQIGLLQKQAGVIGLPMVQRMGVVKSALKKVAKKPVKAVPRRVAVAVKRKVAVKKKPVVKRTIVKYPARTDVWARMRPGLFR